MDRKTGAKSRTYIGAIDVLFNSFKGSYIDSLAWLNKALEDNFGVTDMPIIDIENKSNIRSSMVAEAVPVDYENVPIPEMKRARSNPAMRPDKRRAEEV